jgi:hypothetical protein
MMRSSLKSIAALREREFFFLLPSQDVPVADDYRGRMFPRPKKSNSAFDWKRGNAFAASPSLDAAATLNRCDFIGKIRHLVQATFG